MKTKGVLTIDILNKTIDSIRQFKCDNEVVGFKVNPADLRDIRSGNKAYCGVVNDCLIVIPPYQGLRLVSDIYQCRGYVKPIKRNRETSGDNDH